MIKKIRQIKLKLRACKNLVFKKDSFIYETGWINSIHQLAPVDKYNLPIPWMNYHFVKFVTERLTEKMNIFEYGSGYSTIYWSNYVNYVNSVEYDKKWLNKMNKFHSHNVKVNFNDDIEGGSYSKSCIETNEKYDIIIIDGKKRVECIKYAYLGLNDNGVIILDDSHRDEYIEGFLFLKEKGFKEITFSGIKPVSSKFASTTVFYKASNCLNI